MQPPARPLINVPPSESDEVILVGASVRSAAESARRAGKRVIGIDLFGDTDTLAACDQHLCLRSIWQENSASAADIGRLPDVPVLVVGGLAQKFPLPPTLRRRAIGLTGDGLTDVVSIDSLERIARSACIRFPRTLAPPRSGGVHLGDWPELPSARHQWLTKQFRSTAGLGVTWADSLQLGSLPLHPSSPHFRQLWIAGRSMGASYLADGRRAHVLGACRSLFTRRGKHPFIYSGSVGPINLIDPIDDQLRHLGNACVDILGLRGIFNVDLVMDRGNRLWLLEINPRWSGSSEVIEAARSHQLGPLFRWHLGLLQGTITSDSASFDGLSNEEHQPYQVWKRVVFARGQGVFDRHWLDRALPQGPQRADRRSGLTLRMADIPKHGTPISCGEPVLTLLVQFSNHLPPRSRHLRRLLDLAERSVRRR